MPTSAIAAVRSELHAGGSQSGCGRAHPISVHETLRQNKHVAMSNGKVGTKQAEIAGAGMCGYAHLLAKTNISGAPPAAWAIGAAAALA